MIPRFVKEFTSKLISHGIINSKEAKAIKKVYTEINNLDHEVGVVINSNGKEVYKKQGDKDKIVWEQKEFHILKNRILIHNHPKDSAVLSKMDLCATISCTRKACIAMSIHSISGMFEGSCAKIKTRKLRKLKETSCVFQDALVDVEDDSCDSNDRNIDFCNKYGYNYIYES